MRRLVVGDIHGCLAELLDLFERAGISEGDEVIALGDIVDRGPESAEVLDFFRTRPRTRSLMGNHERKHVRSLRGLLPPAPSQRITRRQIGEERYAEACAFFAGFPLCLELDEAILVHGFVEPGVPLAAQEETMLAGTLTAEGRLKSRFDRPWYELYEGPKPLVVGHHHYRGDGRPLVDRDLVFGLDTGCCHGFALTGMLLPEFRTISVPSRGDHWQAVKARYADVAGERDAVLTWDHAERIAAEAEAQPSLPPHARERLLGLRERLAAGDAAVAALERAAREENARILALLRAECPFDDLPPPEQGRRYAPHIRDRRLAPFLHAARKGVLDAARIRAQFRRPEDAVRLARELGLTGAATADDDPLDELGATDAGDDD